MNEIFSKFKELASSNGGSPQIEGFNKKNKKAKKVQKLTIIITINTSHNKR